MTLLELLVVVAIMAVLATVAITATGNLGSQARFQNSQTALRNIQDAVLGPANLRQSDGSPLATGFVADMGRVPVARDEGGGELSLGELLQPGANALWASRQAVSPNCPTCTTPGDLDASIFLYTGWRGPYLRLLPGETEITDGWGRKLVAGVPGVLAHLLTGAGLADVTAADQPINGVKSFGADETASGTDYNQDVIAQFTAAEYASVLTGTVTLTGIANTTTNSATSNPLYIRVYSPAGTDGSQIRCDFWRIDLTTNITSTNYTFTGLMQGPKVVRAAFTNNAATPQKRFSSPLNVMLIPGNNTIAINLDRPL